MRQANKIKRMTVGNNKQLISWWAMRVGKRGKDKNSIRLCKLLIWIRKGNIIYIYIYCINIYWYYANNMIWYWCEFQILFEWLWYKRFIIWHLYFVPLDYISNSIIDTLHCFYFSFNHSKTKTSRRNLAGVYDMWICLS